MKNEKKEKVDVKKLAEAIVEIHEKEKIEIGGVMFSAEFLRTLKSKDDLIDFLLASATYEHVRVFTKNMSLEDWMKAIDLVQEAKQRLKAKQAAWEAEKEKNNGAGTNV